MDGVAATTEHSACAMAAEEERVACATASEPEVVAQHGEEGSSAASEAQGKASASTAEGEAEAAAGQPSDSSTDAGTDEETAAAPRGGPPSTGSAAHATGDCTPCCFFFKNRCRNGASCEFCHLPHEKRSRGRGCRGHGATKRERLQPPRATPGLVAPPPGLDLPVVEAAPFLAMRSPTAYSAANAAVAYHHSMLLPEASSRHVSPAMALGLGGPAIALGLGLGSVGHPQPPADARLATAARAPPVVLATAAPAQAWLLPPPPPVAAPRGFDALDAASLPRLLGGTRARVGAPQPCKGQEAPRPEGMWGPVPMKVAVGGLSTTSAAMDPTAPIKKRVPDWAV